MGVDIPSKIKFENYDFVGDTFNIICPANLIIVKGHFYLIEAVKYLIKSTTILSFSLQEKVI